MDHLFQGQDYLESLSRRTTNAASIAGIAVKSTIKDCSEESDEDDSDYDVEAELALESYTTPIDEEDCEIDEYVIFKEIMGRLENIDTEWYNALTIGLTEEQKKVLMEISLLADQRRAAKESKRIEQQGGTVFIYS